MKRRDGENYFCTNDNYEAEYRLFETPQPWDQNRYFAFGLDSVIVTTFVGSGIPGEVDGNGTAAQLDHPGAMCMDNSGNIFVGCADKVRRITSLGDVTTFATTPGPEPVGPFALDNGGNIFAIKGNRILKISSTGIVSNYAGSLTGAAGYQNGIGQAALFNTPSSIALVGNNLYVSDRLNHVIRLIVPAAGGAEGNVTLFAGSPNASGDNNGNRLTNALFNKPSAVAVDRLGLFLYVGESSFGAITGPNRIRRIEFATGTVSTIAGGLNAGYADAQGPAALFDQISELETDISRNVYAVEWGNNSIRKISPDGNVSTIAGRPGTGVAYRDGAGSDACFSNPSDIAVDTRGSFFISDHSNNRIRKISQACPLTINGSRIGGRLTAAETENWFEFSIWASGIYYIDAFSGSLANPHLELFGPNDVYGNAIFTNLNGVRSVNLIPGKYRIRISVPGTTTGAYTVRLSTDFIPTDGTVRNGNIKFAGDNNWYEFEVPSGSTGSYTIATSNPSPGLNNTVWLYLYDNITGEAPLKPSPQLIPIHVIEKRNGVGGVMPAITATLAAGQHYWVRVRAGNPDDIGTYQLSVAP